MPFLVRLSRVERLHSCSMNLLAATSATVKPLPDAEDRALAARLARADPAAFDEVVERYGPRVLGLAARLLVGREEPKTSRRTCFCRYWPSRGSFVASRAYGRI